MPELGKAYVQIIPSAEGISGKISSMIGGEAESAGKAGGLSLGNSLVGTLKGVIAAAGIGTVIKETLEAGGNLQQSFGGLDTIYGEAGEAAKKYAYEAQKAGISANDYAENAVSFGASLKQAFEGDTTKAVEAANTAIMDMTDNAAKMGTPIESIQNAYQGFAKGNYTMLDNLKLGYGGTKTEMERLLADAQELTGVEYNMDNLGDVYEAIHVIQGDLGLTGVAAQEASETFTGSFGAMQAAAENLMANLALGEDISAPLQALLGNAEAFILNNLAPMVGNIMAQLPTLLDAGFSTVISGLNIAAENADTLVNQGLELLTSLINGIISNLPLLAEAALNVAIAFGTALVNADWIGIGNQIMTTFQGALSGASPTLLQNGVQMIQNILNGITSALPGILNAGVEIILNVANGILQNLPQLITAAFQIITSLVTFLLQNLPTILEAGANLLLGLVNGIIDNLPEIAVAAIEGIALYVSTIGSMLPQILQKGIEIIGQLVVGLIQAIPKIIAAIPQIIAGVTTTLMEFDWAGTGMDIVNGIVEGIKNAGSNILDALWSSVKAAIDWVKEKLGIASPSKYMADNVGHWMALGVGEGFEDSMPETEMADTVKNTALSMDTAVNSGVASNTNGISYEAIYEAVKAGAEAAHLEIDIDGRDLTRTLKGLGVAMA
jgi:hypothetical protein